MSQPVPNIEPDDVTRLLAREFGDEADAARSILGALSGTHPGAVARVSAAAIKLSRGDLEQLRSAVAMGLADWRDVLSAWIWPLLCCSRSRSMCSDRQRGNWGRSPRAREASTI